MVGATAAWLLLVGGAQAQGRGGGAGTADASGATSATSGRETAPRTEGAPRTKVAKKKAKKPAHEKSAAEGTGSQTPETTGGGR